ncbi:MBL fold metallo-hydrolase [Lysinibacillus sphaericus]|uniref:MBL fold metallo-hydrolase n=1 Tax=Lysinibacillus sphaericus TaxID=1421 RepID=UPI0018CCF051|nr:MBL fold metallo-hydrolase [Lysinibacillus sphaericus]MBG9756381.1 beta-lactamase [Lysinibacillus sphaericus]QTB12597.1 MBL fold metallo-hydrolase [Lysinibacillus sphaericus]
MKVDILASGSSGNCIALTTNETTILIDAGIAKTKIEKRLLEVGITPNNVKAIFVTHAHSDHIKGLPLANKYKIPVYAGEREWKNITTVEDDLIRPIGVGGIFGCGHFIVSHFNVHHDAIDPRGYIVWTLDNFKVSICLDTGKVDKEMLQHMQGSNIYIIEANHEPRMVEASDYPNSVKARILSHVGHLSNEQTATALRELVRGKGERIYLTHLSSKNNLPTLAEMTVKRELLKKGYHAGSHYELEVI